MKNEKFYGLLDIIPFSIKTPPEFTEPESIEALKNLNVLPKDLVIDNLSNNSMLENNPMLRMKMSIELEKKRLELIEKLINERNRIITEKENLKNTKIENIILINKDLSNNNKDKKNAISSFVSKTKLPQKIFTPNKLVESTINTTKETVRFKVEKANRLSQFARNQFIIELKKKATERLKASEREECLLMAQRLELKAQIEASHKKDELNYLKRQEKKKKTIIRRI